MSKFQTLSILGLSVLAGIARAEESPLMRGLTQALKKDPSVCERVAELQSRIDQIGQNGHAEQVMDVKGDFLPVFTQKGHLDDEVAFRSEQGLLPLVTQTTASHSQMEITELLDASLKRLSKTYLDNSQRVKALDAKRTQGFGLFMSQFDRDQLAILKSQRDAHILAARDICRDMEANRVASTYLRHTLAGSRLSRTTSQSVLNSLRGRNHTVKTKQTLKTLEDVRHEADLAREKMYRSVSRMSEKQLRNSGLLDSFD